MSIEKSLTCREPGTAFWIGWSSSFREGYTKLKYRLDLKLRGPDRGSPTVFWLFDFLNGIRCKSILNMFWILSILRVLFQQSSQYHPMPLISITHLETYVALEKAQWRQRATWRKRVTESWENDPTNRIWMQVSAHVSCIFNNHCTHSQFCFSKIHRFCRSFETYKIYKNCRKDDDFYTL